MKIAQHKLFPLYPQTISRYKIKQRFVNSYVVDGAKSKKHKSIILELIIFSNNSSIHFTIKQANKLQHYSKKCKFNHK